MLLLALDTTGSSGSVALLEDRKLLAEAGFEAQLNHSEKLLASLDHLLEMAGRDVKDVAGFCVAAGPGSFTGIRIGLATVNSFAFASGKPVAPVSSLEALALKLRAGEARFLCPMTDAKKGEIFAALFEARGGELAEVLPQAAYAPEAFLARLPPDRLIHFIGTGVAAYHDKILSCLKDKARFSQRSLFIAHEVGLLGYERLRAGQGIPAEKVQPLYFRRSQAEEKH